MRLNLRLPEVKPGEIVVPRQCPTPGCQGKHFCPRQKVKKKVVDVRQNEDRVSMRFADGTSYSADALIAADGVHSAVREILFGAEKPRFTGRVAYRSTFPAALLGGKPFAPSRTKWWGKDRHIVMYYTTARRDEIYFTTSQPEEAGWMTREST